MQSRLSLVSLKPKNEKLLRAGRFRFSPSFRALKLRSKLLILLIGGLAGTGAFADLKVGDKIPSLTLTTAGGQKIHVNSYAQKSKKRNLLFVFFRTGTCRVCIQQLQEFAANLNLIEDNNAKVLALSLDDAIVQKQVSDSVEHKIPILLDPDAKTVNKFGTFNPVDKLSRPSIFLVGPDQKILYSYVGKELADRPPLATVLEMLNHYSGLLPQGARAVSAKPE